MNIFVGINRTVNTCRSLGLLCEKVLQNQTNAVFLWIVPLLFRYVEEVINLCNLNYVGKGALLL